MRNFKKQAFYEARQLKLCGNVILDNEFAASYCRTLSDKINIYNYEINTETDIEREDYVPTVLFNENNPKASLLNRILEKVLKQE